MGLRLLQNGREDVAGLHFLPLRALDVQHRGLQDAAKRGGLFRFALLSALELLDGVVEVVVQVFAQPRQVGAAPEQDALAFRIVRERVQQMLERQIGVPPRHGLAIGDGQDDFERRGEHDCTYSIGLS